MAVDGIIDVEARWYAPLLRPVLTTISRALEQIAVEHDPWSLPRTGLGGAVAIQVARGFGSGKRGSSPRRRAERIAVAALEGYNHRLHVGEPSPEQRARWLARDLGWARNAWESLLDHDEPTLTRVLDRLFGAAVDGCDRPIPEAVLFLRGAVAVGVVLGEVPEQVHDALDRHMTWLGLAWEAHRGTLDASGWDGALAAVGLGEPFPVEPERHAHARAVAALEQLPQRPAVDLFMTALARAPSEQPSTPRRPHAWMPERTPALVVGGRPTVASAGAVELLRERWGQPIEAALAELTASCSDVLGRATEYLRGQSGKRIRPLVTLAAAQACGGDARRALPIAAAVEWLHQGTLVLDDIIDDATLRRGHPALHRATSAPFATGVAAFVFARVVRCSHGMHPEIRRHVVRAAIALAEGERLELRHTGDASLALTRYYEIIEAKTARLFACAAAVGGLAVEAPRKQVGALLRFGRELGLAFQIVDDLLDYVGEQASLGKRPGTDLRAAKLTLPLLLLREQLDPIADARLLAALGRDDELAWVQGLLREHAIADRCRARAATHLDRAIAALDPLPGGPAREQLIALARELGQRRH
ncbi:MAG TPA: polyprenyl synthetase family protein [Enhygromyxa sp.]|nr:polyprenyl synthetase family protein [Enhygromyxa sp.]